MLDRLQDGAPFADDPPPATDLMLAEIRSAPADVGTLVEILRDPEGDRDNEWGLGEWYRFEEPCAQCLVGHLVVFPEVFAPVAEEIVAHPVSGKAFLSAIGSHDEFSGVLADPYLPALRRIAGPPWDEDKVLSLTCALGETSSPETLEILRTMRESFPAEESKWFDWLDRIVKKVERRLAGEESTTYRTEWPEAVRKLREELTLRGDPPPTAGTPLKSAKVSPHRPTPGNRGRLRSLVRRFLED